MNNLLANIQLILETLLEIIITTHKISKAHLKEIIIVKDKIEVEADKEK
jgi:hypothetical protein